MAADSLSSFSFPDYELVVILAAERCQVFFVVGERETLNQNLVHLEPVHHLQSVEVPNDDVGLEALVGLLAASNVLASVRDNYDGDLIVVAAEELLCSANNVSNNDGGAQREDEVLVVRVEDQAIVHLALESNNSREV